MVTLEDNFNLEMVFLARSTDLNGPVVMANLASSFPKVNTGAMRALTNHSLSLVNALASFTVSKL